MVLHAPITNGYWVIITFCVIALVGLPGALLRMWRAHPDPQLLVFGGLGSVGLVLAIAYFQHKARWVVADARGLTITERTRVHLIPWPKVRSLIDLGYLGSAPNARRYHLEFADGDFFTFLADTDAMARLEALRERWGIRATR